MGRSDNPFTPAFGKLPFAFAGRDEFIDDVLGGLENQPGDPNRTTIFIGPRGSGKTALMRKISNEAEQIGWVCVRAATGPQLMEELLYTLQFKTGVVTGDNPLGSITALSIGPVGVEREITRPAVPVRFQLEKLIEQINERGRGVMFLIDEVDPANDDLLNFISHYQMFVSEDRDVALILGGLPGKVSDLLVADNVSFIRRAFQHELKPIGREYAEHVLLATIRENGRDIDQDALYAAAELSCGYPYTVQLVGYHLWKEGRSEGAFTLDDVLGIESWVEHSMETAVFKPTLRELTIREEEYLQAMAQDEGPSSTSDVAKRMGISMTNASNLRRRLISQGIICEQRMGIVDFDIPMLRSYMQRGGAAW